MKRDDAISILEKIMDKVESDHNEDSIIAVYLFGSLSKGSLQPNDIDLFILLKGDKHIRYAEEGIRVWKKYRGRNQDVDMIINSQKDFDESFHFAFKKDNLIKIWDRNDKDWRCIVQTKCPVDKTYVHKKAFQFKNFKSDIRMINKIQEAVDQEIVTVTEIAAEEYYYDLGPWNIEMLYIDEKDGKRTEVVEIEDDYLELKNYLDDLKEKKINIQYINTLKVLYSYAVNNNIYFDIYNELFFSPHSAYTTYIESDDGEILARFYLIDLEMVLFHFYNRPEVKELILVPKYKTTSQNNYLYTVKRGINWSKKKIDELYEKHRGY